MAKSKSGGTRAYIRGRVGSDVYSVGKTAKGKKQQVVRSLAETVANPQTEAQMFGRMIMSTIMQAVPALRFIIDHSFDNVTGKQPNISEFIGRNYGLIKADAIAHPASGNLFGLNKYQEKGIKQGRYIMSDGNALVPSTLSPSSTSDKAGFSFGGSTAMATLADVAEAWGLKAGDYATFVYITQTGLVWYIRASLKAGVDLTPAPTAENVKAMFDIESNQNITVAVDEYVIDMTFSHPSSWDSHCYGLIVSKYEDGKWNHNSCTLVTTAGKPTYTADDALPTYPVGGADFINGGDIFG